MSIRDDLVAVLNEQGVDDLHSWRCDHPERYGACSCKADLADAILARFDVAEKRKIIGYRDEQVQYTDGSWSREFTRVPVYEGDDR